MHRGLTVSVPPLRMWVHCPRASNGLLPRRSNLVGYVRWDAQSDRFPPCQTIISTALQVAIRLARDPTKIDAKRPLSDFIWLVQFLVSCPISCLTLTLRYARVWQAP